MSGAIDHGCTPEQAVYVFRSIWFYTGGEILVRAHAKGRRTDEGQPTQPQAFFTNLDLSQLPRLASIGDQWPALASRDTYPEGLHAFVDGLLAQARPTGRK